MMMRRLVALAAVMTMLMAIALPVAAEPPEESGVVVRIFDDREGFGIFPDVENGYWVFSNVDRDAFCTWFYDMGGEPFPMNLNGDGVQLVFASDAVVVTVDAGGPTSLHAFTGDEPGNPCDGSEAEAALTGDVKVRVNDNDGPNTGKRANSFGDRGQGTLYDADGDAYHYSWTFRAVWGPDENDGTDPSELKVVADKFNLQRKG
jgi:hypothetical protein